VVHCRARRGPISGEGRKGAVFPRKQTILTQGEVADAVFYIQEGKVRLTVASKTGKEATLGLLGEDVFEATSRTIWAPMFSRPS
jgi:Cyclic nucleotide-binding domain